MSYSTWWYTVSKGGKKMVSLLQNLTATFLCYKCICWWENNGQRWVKRTLQRTYCRCQRYTRKITFWLDLTHISTSLWLRCRIFCPCLRLDRRSPEKSFDCPINQIPTHQLNFSQYVKFLIQKSLEECVPTSLVVVWSHQITGTMFYIVQTVHLNCYNIISCGKKNLAKHTNMRSPIQFKKERKTGWFKVQPLL